jgi:hypothetical protein
VVFSRHRRGLLPHMMNKSLFRPCQPVISFRAGPPMQ